MTFSQTDQPTLISIAPRFPVGDMEQALAFYAQLGFTTDYRYGEFPLTSQPWGMKEFFLCDPFRNLLLFGESIPEEESSTEPGA
jgi:catechol 2,3-dioxygenase-like lactoylglutathione lyase family enzyme